MSSLSWMLYAADVVDGIKIVSMCGGIVAGITIMCRHMGAVLDIATPPKQKRAWLILVMLFSLFILTPNKNTILLIAASEAVNTVATSTTGKEILDDSVEVIRGWLKEQKKSK